MFRRFLILALLLCAGVSVVLAEDECFPQDGCLTPVVTYGLPVDEIEAHPTPEVDRLLPNDHLLYSHNYRRVLGAVEIFDAPDGNVIDTRPDGNYFVSVQAVQGDWTEINSGEWVRTEYLGDPPISRLGGVLLADARLPYPVGWIRTNVHPSARPGGRSVLENLPLLAHTLVNIFAEFNFGGQRWYQVGVNQWVEQSLVAGIGPIERPAEVDTHRWVGVDLSQQVAIAYEDSTPAFAALISSGISATPTGEGLFHVYVRFNRTPMRSDSSSPFFYYMEDVPWTMYFNGNQALHGTYWHNNFGYPRSHGCINFSMTDAYWLYNWLSEEIDITAQDVSWPAVYVYS